MPESHSLPQGQQPGPEDLPQGPTSERAHPGNRPLTHYSVGTFNIQTSGTAVDTGRLLAPNIKTPGEKATVFAGETLLGWRTVGYRGERDSVCMGKPLRQTDFGMAA